ncbi:MAG: hypothetical protein HUK21_12655, partial [Fibrobacteraceae bacterium]|nr:hypothetical protein [Fibrobacteraceae bacterium]
MSSYSPDEIVSSIFKKFENKRLSPEFIRDESNRVSDALSSQRVGDPGRTTRSFADSNWVQKDNAAKANAYIYKRIDCTDANFLSLTNVYDAADFDKEKYELLVYLDKLRTDVAKNSANLESIKEILDSNRAFGSTTENLIQIILPQSLPINQRAKKIIDAVY